MTIYITRLPVEKIEVKYMGRAKRNNANMYQYADEYGNMYYSSMPVRINQKPLRKSQKSTVLSRVYRGNCVNYLYAPVSV